MSSAIYPGSFDPITNGHFDIICRAAKIFDKVTVAVLTNSSKKPMFTTEEKMEMIKHVTRDLPNVEVDTFSGLLIDYAKQKDCNVVVKGLRAVTDFEYEFQMALMNKKLHNDLETLFLTTNNKYSYLSSSIVKEVFKLNGCVEELVDNYVIEQMKKKL